MKRTTYILIGLFFAGILLISGIALTVFIMGEEGPKGVIALDTEERVEKELPACRVVMFEHWDFDKGSTEKYGNLSYTMFDDSFSLEVQASDKNLLSYPAGVDAYLSTEVEGDTLKIRFDLPEKKIKELKDKYGGAVLMVGDWKLSLTKETKYIVNGLWNQSMAVRGFATDSLTIDADYVHVTMDSCRVDVLDVRKAVELKFNSGGVRDLYMDVDEVRGWRVNADAFDIGTMYLTGNEGWIELARGDCERMRWIPKSDGAKLQVTLNEPAWVTIER